MKKYVVIIAVILAAVIVFFFAKPMGADLDGLGGEPWMLGGVEVNGKRIPPREWAGMKAEFGKDQVLWTVMTEKGPATIKGEFAFDPKTNPKRIDLIHPFDEEVSPGIYKIEDDILIICVGPRRPADFSSKGPQMVMVFKRG